jgi:hypothetical protein
VPVLIAMGARLSPAILALATATGDYLSPLVAMVLPALSSLGLVLDLLATAWLGMLLGLTARKPGRAATYTILWMVGLPLLLSVVCLPMFLLDLPIILWARDRLHRRLRALAAQRSVPGPRVVLTPLTAHPPARS